MSYFAALRRFNRNVNLFLIAAAIIGFTNFGGFFAALFNIYLLRLGYETKFIGSINAVGSVALLVACLPASLLERRLGSRITNLLSLGIIVTSNFLLQGAVFIPEAQRSVFILVANALSFTGLAIYFVSCQPFLAASTTPMERGHAFSIQAAAWPLSGFMGSLVGGALPGYIAKITGIPLTSPGPYQLTLWAAAIFK